MEAGFQLFPEQASTAAVELDYLYFFLIAVSVFFTLLISFSILAMIVRYRRGSPASRANPVEGNLLLEATWAFVPLVIMMICFMWGARLFYNAFNVPEDNYEVFVVGKQWMWKMYHPNGKVEINELHVPTGRPIRLTMISEDVIHSFFVPAFRAKQDVLPGRYTTMWFEATRTGDHYHLFCAEYCGTSHSLMTGRVVVMEPRAFAEWLQRGEAEPIELAGQQIFERNQCDACHTGRPGARGPNLAGLYGSRVQLDDGNRVIADRHYIRRSILDPQSQTVSGYPSIMPAYQDQITEEEIVQVTAYIQSLSAPHPEVESEG